MRSLPSPHMISLHPPRRHLGTHSHFVAPQPPSPHSQDSPSLPFIFLFISPPNPLPPSSPPPPPPPKPHFVNRDYWPGIYFPPSSTHYLYLSIFLPLSPSRSFDLSIFQQQFQNRWLHLAQGKNIGFGLQHDEGHSFTLTQDLISWYPARNVHRFASSKNA